MKKVLLAMLMFCMIFSQCMAVQAADVKGAKKAKYTISINKSVYTMKKGKKVTLKASLNSAAKKKGVVWSSSNKKVATVSSKGKVVAKKKGKATITAKVKGTKVKATCKITVGTPVSKIKLNKKSVDLELGKTFKLKATVSPKKPTNKKVTYKSSNKAVATVSSKGVVKGKKTGTAKITVSAADGAGAKATCNITVKDGAVTSVALNKSALVIEPGNSETLTATVNPFDAKDKTLAWTTANANVATVDANGTVTALALGSTQITAAASNGISASCNVTVSYSGICTVTFDSNGGSSVSLQEVKKGEKASQPDTPIKMGNFFEGWYTDRALTTPYDFNQIVTQNITLYAKWREAAVYTVTFDSNGGSGIEAQQVSEGGSAYQPDVPIRRGFVFGGWYSDNGFTNAYNFNSVLSGNITLYAKWSALEVHITLDVGNYSDNIVHRTVHGTITSNAEIVKIQSKLLNEQDVPEDVKAEEIDLGSAQSFVQDVFLQDGTNKLSVTVTTIDGTDTTAAAEMKYDSGHVYDVNDSSIVTKELDSENDIIPETANLEDMPEENSGEKDGTVLEGLTGEDDEEPLEEELPEEDKVTLEEEPEEQGGDSLVQSTTPDKDTSAAKILYVANVFDLYFNEDISFESRKAFITETLKGEVVGYLNGIDMMQVKFTGSLPALSGSTSQSIDTISFDELKEYAVQLYNTYKDQFGLTAVELEFAYSMSDTAVETNDPWDSSNGDADWWLDKIGAKSAWEYDNINGLDFLSNIVLGAVDAGFHAEHEDLLKNIKVISQEKSAHDHGTHVAGIMAATADNGKGLSGIAHNNALIKAYDAQKDGEIYLSDADITAGFVKTVEAKAKVINFSLGSSSSVEGESRANRSVLEYDGRKASTAMGRLLSKGYDFIVVQSAGNGNKNGKGIAYDQNGRFCSINASNCYQSGNVSKEDIMGRILVVSAVDQNGKMAPFSNGKYEGGELNLIAAPGVNIYSCIQNGYDYMSGTSMAAPMVTASCGLAWSVNPALDGKAIVKLIMENTEGIAQDADSASYTKGGMGIINVGKAAEAAYNTRASYYGEVVDSVNGESIDAQVKIHKDAIDGEVVGGNISMSDGRFDLPKLPAGNYVLEITKEGYVPVLGVLDIKDSVAREDAEYVGKYALTSELNAGEYRIILTWGETPRDLDSHLVANLSDGSRYHVYFSDKNPSPEYANLDWDDTSSYGPETITITNFAGLYHTKYAVYDYTNGDGGTDYSTALSNSGATVAVYKGTRLLRTFHVPSNTEGTEWDVFTFDAAGNIIPINTMKYCDYSSNVLGTDGLQTRETNASDSRGYNSRGSKLHSEEEDDLEIVRQHEKEIKQSEGR